MSRPIVDIRSLSSRPKLEVVANLASSDMAVIFQSMKELQGCGWQLKSENRSVEVSIGVVRKITFLVQKLQPLNHVLPVPSCHWLGVPKDFEGSLLVFIEQCEGHLACKEV